MLSYGSKIKFNSQEYISLCPYGGENRTRNIRCELKEWSPIPRSPLRSHLLDPTDGSNVNQLADMVNNNNEWDIPKLSSLFAGEDWFSVNLCPQEATTQWEVPWNSLFSSTLWQLWKSRNDKVFNNVPHATDDICSRSVTWARYYHEGRSRAASIQSTHPERAYWKAPDLGWICMNVDGAIASTTSYGSVGGVFRDHEGSWILGFNKPIGIMKPLQAELWAILTDLQLAWDHGFELLQIQTDSLEAVHLLDKSDATSSSMSLVRSIDKLRRRAWVTNLLWIPRRNNSLADAIAKATDINNASITVFDEPPSEFLDFLDSDKPGL
ncbi:hypothetical protein F3Y22_tig00004035pilonHSYRG00077 [Hibiscus syriacus]|uniref:RNase H type-1 domain-containing protein n=1 Tax=Hibiscus syriacus TaxID=106335 RepID=A0A6A3CIJ8_HIBSY|nr:hypothetical protein F3Y22_tig00004035pilonHSYRG00077 [Hibiscus syriacus]